MSRLFLRILLFILIIYSTDPIIGQDKINEEIKSLKDALKKVESVNNKLNLDLKNTQLELSTKLDKSDKTIDSLKTLVQANELLIQNIKEQLGNKITVNEDKANKRIEIIDNTISKNTLYWIIAALLIAFLSIILYIILRKQLKKEKTDITENIHNTKKLLEEEGIKLDNKLIELLTSQLQIMRVDDIKNPITEDIDHSLALKVADEIVRILKNLSNMDSDTRGLKQLTASVKRIQDNFEANGYELINMLNLPYNAGMKVSANFKPDENLKKGEEIITRIIKPQVNFKGVMIQSAQIEVSVGE